ncbi:MAG: cell wall/surface repeat protein, partial [Verrucomicrobiaceae bacterium]|nr:cell wall/surface repeat protein [Verrucomicrobiaceae bacterium]
MKYLYSLLLTVTLMHTGQVMAAALGDDWKLRSSTGTSENLSAIAVDGTTRMVAVGAHGAIVTSTAPGTWTRSAENLVTTNLTDVIWITDYYVAVGDRSTFLTSDNGVAWVSQAAPSPGTDLVNAVAASDISNLVAVGGTVTGAGLVFHSNNKGVTWNRIPVAGATTFKDVTHTGSKFIAVCTGKVFTSTDGSNWNATPAVLAGTTPTSVAFVPNAEPTLSTAVIIGTKSWASVNNGPWTAISPPSSDLTLNVVAKAVDGKLRSELIGTNSYGEVWSSTDMGKSWQIRLTAQYIQLNAASKFGDDYVVVGNSGTIETSSGLVADALYRQIVPPLDGQTVPPLLGNFTSVATNSASGAVAVGAGGQIISASAFDTWVKRDSKTPDDLTRVIWTGTQYVAVGTHDAIVTSPDGVEWTKRSLPVSSEKLTGVTANSSMLLAVGENANHNGITQRSIDGGQTWISGLVSFTLNNKTVTAPGLVDVTWTGFQFVAVANGYSLASADGITWTATPLAGLVPTHITTSGGTLRQIISGNKSFISSGSTWAPLTLPATNLLIDALGTTLRGVSPTGEVWTSSDEGSTWQFLSPAEEKGVGLAAAARFADGHDVYVGKNGLVQTFKAPLNWSPVTASANGVAWNGQSGAAALYVAVGWDISWTGVQAPAPATAGEINWTPHRQGDASTPFSGVTVLWSGAPGEAPAAGDQFIAVGTNIWTSPDGITWTVKARGPSTDPSVYAVSKMGSKIYAFGYDNARYQVMLSTSQDKGSTWTAFTDVPGRQWAMLSAAKADIADNYLAVGWGGHVMHSATGELNSWSEYILPLASGEDFTSVTWGQFGPNNESSLFIAVTSKGGIWISDGVNWGRSSIWKRNASNQWVKSANSLASNSLWTVKRVGKQFIAAGNSGYLLKSFNGFDWREYAPYDTEGSSPLVSVGSTTPQYINDLLYTKEAGSPILIAAGGLGTFLSSEGGGDAVQPTINFNLPTLDGNTVKLFSEHGGVYPIVMQLKNKIFDVPTTITLSITSTNKYNLRYRLSVKSLTFAKGETVKPFNLTGIDDHLVQGDEVLTLSAVASLGDYQVNTETIGIIDDEPLRTVSFAAATSSLAEPLAGATGVSTITVTLSAVATASVVVPLRFSGTAMVGKDYTRPASVTIPAGQTTASFEIKALGDLIAKGDRTVVIDIGQPLTVAGIGADNRHTLTITDNDYKPFIASQPLYGLYKVGKPVLFSAGIVAAEVDNAVVDHTGQWFRNGLAIPGWPAIAYKKSDYGYLNIIAALTNAGDYTFRATSVPGTVTTQVSRLAVVDGATQSVTVKSGGSAILKVATAGTGLTYQWKKNNTELTGETQSTLTRSNITTSGDKYVCTVTLRSYAANGSILQDLHEDSGEITVNIISAVPVVTPPVFRLAGVGADVSATPTATPAASLWTISDLPA